MIKLIRKKLYFLMPLISAACVDLEGPVIEDLGPQNTLSQFQMNSSAIMIAKGDSIVIGYNLVSVSGDQIEIDPGNATWTSSDAIVASVNPDGTVLGKTVSAAPVSIIGKYRHNYVTRYDTVMIYVTEGRVDANQLQLVALDSQRVGAVFSYTPPRVRVDLYKNGHLVQKGATFPIFVTSPATGTLEHTGGPDREPIYRIRNDKNLIGKFWVKSSLNLYGNEVGDSLEFTGLYGSSVTPFATYLNSPSTQVPILDTIPVLYFQKCATVNIMNQSVTDTIDILFSDSTASSDGCEPGPSLNFGFNDLGVFVGGNVLSIPPRSTAVRKSNTIGRIVYFARYSRTRAPVPWFLFHIEQRDVQD